MGNGPWFRQKAKELRVEARQNKLANALAVGGISVTILTAIVIPRSAATVLVGSVVAFLLFLNPIWDGPWLKSRRVKIFVTFSVAIATCAIGWASWPVAKKLNPVRRYDMTNAGRHEPGPEPFRNLPNDQLSRWIIEEADKLNDLANKDIERQKQRGSEPGISVAAKVWVFNHEFWECCAQDLRELRAEIFGRLGPAAKDPNEILQWNALHLSEKDLSLPDLSRLTSPFFLQLYIPYLRDFAVKVKRLDAPRLPVEN
jgi:heme/copper-type cytochrome/quinol oxidase subunit 2